MENFSFPGFDEVKLTIEGSGEDRTRSQITYRLEKQTLTKSSWEKFLREDAFPKILDAHMRECEFIAVKERSTGDGTSTVS